jgi:hypothetical protein
MSFIDLFFPNAFDRPNNSHLFYSGFFWHIDSLHFDANFTLNGDRTNCKSNFFPHN